MVGPLFLVAATLSGCLPDAMVEPLNEWDPLGFHTRKRDAAAFQEARQLNDLKPTNNAIAVAVDNRRWAWGASDSAATEDQAATLALQECREQAKVKYIINPCKVYFVNGRKVSDDPK